MSRVGGGMGNDIRYGEGEKRSGASFDSVNKVCLFLFFFNALDFLCVLHCIMPLHFISFLGIVPYHIHMHVHAREFHAPC